MACAATMRRRWPYQGWIAISLNTRKKDVIAHLLVRSNRRRFDNTNLAISFALERRGIESQESTAPPETCGPSFGHRRKPILPKHDAHLARRLMRKRIALKKAEYVFIGKQTHFGSGYDWIILP